VNCQPNDLNDRLQVARTASREAGSVLLHHFGRLSHVAFKGRVDLVTEADRAAEDHLIARVRQTFPDDGILAEESGASVQEQSPWLWIIDPLDGTTNYVHGLPHYGVSVGLSFNGELVGGVIHAPSTGKTYWAAPGCGAFEDEKPLQVSSRANLEEALLVTGFPYDRARTAVDLLGPVERALQRSRGLRRMGAASLDFVAVACGIFDGYWEARLKPWDMAAGVVLVREAGGCVTGLHGEAFTLAAGHVSCSNGHIHDDLVDMVRGPRD
jgi:myo-inositol-1(or 4)-monophosphatase